MAHLKRPHGSKRLSSLGSKPRPNRSNSIQVNWNGFENIKAKSACYDVSAVNYRLLVAAFISWSLKLYKIFVSEEFHSDKKKCFRWCIYVFGVFLCAVQQSINSTKTRCCNYIRLWDYFPMMVVSVSLTEDISYTANFLTPFVVPVRYIHRYSKSLHIAWQRCFLTVLCLDGCSLLFFVVLILEKRFMFSTWNMSVIWFIQNCILAESNLFATYVIFRHMNLMTGCFENEEWERQRGRASSDLLLLPAKFDIFGQIIHWITVFKQFIYLCCKIICSASEPISGLF